VSFQHFLLTRFNVGKVDEDWLTFRFELFDRFCYPSVMNQTCRNFEWLIFYDSRTPVGFVDMFEQYDGVIAIPVVVADMIPEKFMRSKKGFENVSFITRVGGELGKEARRQVLLRVGSKTDYLITTRIDSDDSLHRDYVRLVQDEYFDEQGFWYLNFLNGYRYETRYRRVYAIRDKSSPYLTLVETVTSGKTAFWAPHTKETTKGKITHIEDFPGWLEVVHGENFHHDWITCQRCGAVNCDCGIDENRHSYFNASSVIRNLRDSFLPDIDLSDVENQFGIRLPIG